MNSMERILATIQGKPVDRRPVSLTLSLYGARLTGCPLSKYYNDAAAYARGQSAVLETFMPDILFGPFALPLEGEAFGSKVRLFENQAPNLAKPAISSANEITRLTIPDTDSHPRLLYFREAIQIISAEHGKQVSIAAIALSPVDIPAMILGIDGWLETLLFDKDGVKRMLEITIPYFVRRVNALLAEGANFLVLPAAFCNSTIVTRDITLKIAVPAMKEAFSQVNGPIILHPAGQPMVPFIDLLADLPNVVGFVLNERESFAEAREKIGSKFVLLGNIDGPTLFNRGAGDIRTECKKLLHDRCNDPHFILGTSAADIGIHTPPENIHVIRQAAEEFAEEKLV